MRSKKALINIISSVFLQIIRVICGFIVPKLIISSFGSKVNGLVASITQFLGFITLLEAGFGTVIKSVLYKPIANKDKTTIEKILKASEKIFRGILGLFVLYLLILCIFLPLKLANEFDILYTVSLILIISISIFAEYFFGITYRLYLQAEQKRYIISGIHIVTLILNVIFVFILIKLGANIQVVKLASTFIYLLRPVIQLIYVNKKYKINLKKVSGNYKIKQKWDGLAQHIAAVVHNNTDVVLLTLCGSLEEISVYSVYAMIINRVKEMVQSFTGGIDAAFGDMIAKNEHDNLNRNFKVYEGLYFTVVTAFFCSTLFLIVSFISVYTNSVRDANYIRPIFAWIMILAELVAVVRQPYNDLIKVSGHFKETRIGAWVEAVVNIVVSFALVWKFGILGVAIGTLAAMSIRGIEFVYYTSKYILKRSVWIAFKNFSVIIAEIIIVSMIMYFMPEFNIYNYKTWIFSAICIFCISSFIVVCINLFVYKESFQMLNAKCKRLVSNKFKIQSKNG